MVEPSAVNLARDARVYGSINGEDWRAVLSWQKDRWPPGLFQYGNIFLPDGENTTSVLALSTIAVQSNDLETSFWSVAPRED
jgi:hypothetical protein